jgi:hypothetical protein
MRTPPKVPTPMATTSASTGVTHPSGRFFFVLATSFGGVPAGSWFRGLDIVFSFLGMLRMD